MESNSEDTKNNQGCWKRKSGCQKKVIVAFAVIGLILAASAVVILIGFLWSLPITKNFFYKVCKTSQCQIAAKRIKEAMNESASPCDDLYKYACGGYEKTVSIPDDQGIWGPMDSLRTQLAADCIPLLEEKPTNNSDESLRFPEDAVENAKAFFQACVGVHTEINKTDTLPKRGETAALKSVLQSIGCLSKANPSKNKPWYTLISDVRRLMGLNILITFQVDVDAKNPENYIIYLDQQLNFGLSRNKLLDLEKSKVYVDAYKTYLRAAWCILNGKDNCSSVYRQTAIQNTINFESKVAKLTKDPQLRRDPHALYVRMPISKLQKNVNSTKQGWTWNEFINYVLYETNQTVNSTMDIVVKEESYLKELILLLSKENATTVSDYVCQRVMQVVGPFSSKEFREKEFQFHKITKGIQKQPDIKVKCFVETNDFYGFAVGSLYVKKKFDKAAKQDMDQMGKKIADAFRKLVEESTWMDVETKKKALLKLSQMVSKIGYPEWILNQVALNNYYEYLQGISLGNFTHFLVQVMHAKSVFDLKKLTQKFNRSTEWTSVPPSVVNAFYSPSANTITFPAGILQPPFYQHNALHSLNYGAIGNVIGHEITHGFDDEGCEYNGVGKLESWWTNETKVKYNEKAKCFVDQYSAKYVILDNEKFYVKGDATIGENIADNGGIREAYRAYLTTGERDKRLPGLEHLDNKKLFFLSAANIWCTKYRTEAMKNRITYDEHSPGQFRATIPMANTEEFAKVFGCKKGSGMNPEKKCVLW